MQIEINNISKSFGKNKVIDDISLVSNSAEILCLLGPSGAGKTTLIRLITGAISPDSGTIIIDGIKVPSKKIMKRIGFMTQSDALYTDISGLDNLLFFGRLFGLNGDNLKQNADNVLKLVDLIADKNKLVTNYSGGMKKRLSLAVALIHNPDILILDEPTVGIDPVLRKTIWDEFEKLRRQGRTIIVSTHVMDEAGRCQKAALIYNGKLIANDKVDVLISQTPTGKIEELFFMVGKAGK